MKPEYAETLVGHSQLAAKSFRLMFGTMNNPSLLAKSWFRFFKLHDFDGQFFINGFIASALHDIGKANNGFQQMLHGYRDAQAIRHEHLSGLILTLPETDEWLQKIPLINTDVLIGAIIGHHLKADKATFACKLNADLSIFSIYPKRMIDVLEIVASDQQIAVPSFNGLLAAWSFNDSPGYFALKKHREDIQKRISCFRRRLYEESNLHRLLIAVRSALIIADSAASGLMREGKDIEAWLRNSFGADVLLNAFVVEDKIITPRIKQLECERHFNFQWQGFQNAAENLSSRSLLLASCGSGKTLAAWRWIKGQLKERPVSRIIFLYPTRGTATEGFRDYIAWAPEADAALMHGTSTFDLDGMFENCEDSRWRKDFTTEDRLFALAYWQRRIFSATVDQFLGFMQQVYSSICLMPLLADSIIVFDEVHSFDRNLFSALKRFLKEFDVPVLCMTASLPVNRRQELVDYGLTIFPENLQDFPDLQRVADMPRYSVHCLAKESDARAIAVNALTEGKRVLWVVNTVNRCQKLSMEFKALCYHSRFKLKDRKLHHNEVINAFSTSGNGLLAITTQVCEMSLDLDADVLITESAPITSLIQRMGRCNRHARLTDHRFGMVYIYPPESEAPYQKEEMIGVTDFLQKVNGNYVSQSELEKLLEDYGPVAVEPERYAAFLESGPWAMAREESLREEHDFVIQCILDSDIETFLSLKEKHMPVDGFVVSVPHRFASVDSRTVPFSLAPASHYSDKYGFLDKCIEVGYEQ